MSTRFRQLYTTLGRTKVCSSDTVFILDSRNSFTKSCNVTRGTRGYFRSYLAEMPLLVGPPGNITLSTNIASDVTRLMSFCTATLSFTRIRSPRSRFNQDLHPVLTSHATTIERFIYYRNNHLPKRARYSRCRRPNNHVTSPSSIC